MNRQERLTHYWDHLVVRTDPYEPVLTPSPAQAVVKGAYFMRQLNGLNQTYDSVHYTTRTFNWVPAVILILMFVCTLMTVGLVAFI